MNPGTASKPNAAPDELNWYKELGLIRRFPRPYDWEFLTRLKEPRISLQSKKSGAEIVIRFTEPSTVFPAEMVKHLAKFGITLAQAFEGVLWSKPEGESNTTWTELTRPAIKAYREAWFHLFKLIYVGHFHPEVDAWLRNIATNIESESKIVRRRGRQSESQQEAEGLRARYCELLGMCKRIHSAAEHAAMPFEKRKQRPSSTDLKRAIWKQIAKSVHGMPHDSFIFSGEAFKDLSRRNVATLETPKTWKASQLAIILLAMERNQEYQTVQKKIRPTKLKCGRSSYTRK